MQFLSRHLTRWPIALACVVVLAAAILLPGLGTFGLWEPQERQLADRVAPRAELAAKPKPQDAVVPPTKDTCQRVAPKDPVARSLTNRAMVWGRDTFGDSDAGRRLPLALLGLLTVLAAAGTVMRLAGPRAGVLTALVLLSMPLLVFQSRQLMSEIGIAAGAALTLYGLVALGRPGPLWILDSFVALVALAAGIVIGFVAGGALLGLLVPIGAFAAAHGFGLNGFGEIGSGIRRGVLVVAARVSPNSAAGRQLGSRRDLAWLGLAVGVLCLIGWAIGVLFAITNSAVNLRVLGVLLYGGILLVAAALWAIARSGPAPVEHVKALVATIATVILVGLLAYELYSLVEPQPGLTPPQRALFGKAIVASGCWSPALGALWRPEDDLRFSFDSTFEQIAFGTFPWGVLGPVAMAALLASSDARRRAIGALTLAWAGAAWLAAEAFQRKVGFTLYAGFPALAIAIGAWLDGLWSARKAPEGADASDENAFPTRALLVALFVVLAVIDLGKDMGTFPDRLSSLLVGSDQIAYPKMSRLLGVKPIVWVFVLGALFAFAFALAAGLRGWLSREVAQTTRRLPMRTVARIGVAAALVGTAVFAAFWAFVWQPVMATHLSSKAMFDTYLELRKQGDQLVIMGELGDAPHAYAPNTKPEVVPTRKELVDAIGRPQRVFAIAPQTELCQLHREIGGKPYFVIDDRNTRSLLLSNRVEGTVDKNPLRTAILHHEPKQMQFRPKKRIVFQNSVEVIGWDIPKAVERGDKFRVTMYYKILQPVGGNWRVLFHFDGSLRFNGDHEPIKGRCQTSTWQPGDYIVDTHTVTAGANAFAPGSYDVWTGFFTGANPNWKNMPVSEAPPEMRDTTDRVKITTITLQ